MAETVKGLKKLLKQLNDLPNKSERDISRIVQNRARRVERDAKIRAPKDFGVLARSITTFETADPLTYKVAALAKYAPYMEFGTGGLVSVPPEMQQIASQFKGRGLKRIDIRPRPYLYPALRGQRKEFIKDIEKYIEKKLNELT